ncbi:MULTISPECIES: TolC family protein [unclassified Helicobacter]|uniref:TolC family protein n=1 Tax=unclassified Helicobacter TaxID=2593540 RepID=UPI001315A259|nr:MULTISPECIES: TolC family protein [unclassified Helicobacter]
MKFVVSALALIIFFTGCATLPKDDELITQIGVPKDFIHQKTLQTLGQKNIVQKDYLQTFFDLFQDKELEALIHQALKNNTNLLTLESKIAQARSNAKISTANLFPSTSINLNYNYSDRNYKNVQVNYNQNSLNAALSLSWEIDLFGKLNALRKANIQTYLASQQTLENAKVSLIADVATYYFTILQLHQMIELNRLIINNLEDIFLITEQKYKIGLVDISDLNTAKNNLLSQKNSLLSLQYSLEQNQNALLVLLNQQEYNFNFDNEKIFAQAQIPIINSMPSSVLLNRPDVSSGIHTLRASFYTKTNKQLALLPSISISGSLGELLLSSAGAGQLVWQIASSLAMPLLNRQSLTQAYISAKEDLKQAYYSLQNIINTAIQEINNASINLKTSQESFQNSQEGFNFFTNVLENTKKRRYQNLIDDLSVLEVENNYYQAKNNLISASLQLNTALILLYKAFAGNFNTIEEK